MKTKNILQRALSCLTERRLPWIVQQWREAVAYKTRRVLGRDIDYYYGESYAIGFNTDEQLRLRDAMGACLCDILAPRSVTDYGCGTAGILAHFEKKGIAVLGVDASRANRKHARIDPSHFVVTDLRRPYVPARRYDVCLCTEVAEHIEEKYAATLVSNLVAASPTVIFCGAPPGQGGMGHWNEKPHEWWVGEFAKHNYRSNTGLRDEIRKRWSAIPEMARYTMYVDNVMVFQSASG